MYLPGKYVVIELEKVKNTPYDTEWHILKFHMAKREIMQSGFQ